MRPLLQTTKLAQRAAHALAQGDFEAAGDYFALARLGQPSKREVRAGDHRTGNVLRFKPRGEG